MRAPHQLLIAAVVALLVPGCFLDRNALDAPPADGGQPPDMDAAGVDAFVPPEDDAGPNDAGTPDTGTPCVPTSPVDLCDGADDDCNPGTADGSGEEMFGDPCDGGDMDECPEGTMVCTADGLRCSDTTGDSVEVCNGVDDDCDLEIDQGTVCPCTHDTFGGHSYLFCDETVVWSTARSSCPTGYLLGRIDSREEHDFVVGVADGIARDNWWFGGTDASPISPDGQFRWLVGGDPIPLTGGAGFSNWGGGQPDGSADCLELGMGSNGVLGIRGRWNDAPCSDEQRYVCESLPPSD